MTYPNTFDQIILGSIDQAYDMGAVASWGDNLFGSVESSRQIQKWHKLLHMLMN